VVSFTSLPLYPRGKSPWYPLDKAWVVPRAGLDDVEKVKRMYTLIIIIIIILLLGCYTVLL
jgi:hypothetical protein